MKRWPNIVYCIKINLSGNDINQYPSFGNKLGPMFYNVLLLSLNQSKHNEGL